jgi:hypothetical protein
MTRAVTAPRTPWLFPDHRVATRFISTQPARAGGAAPRRRAGTSAAAPAGGDRRCSSLRRARRRPCPRDRAARDRLVLDSGIYRNPFEIFGVDRPYAVGHRKALLQQRGFVRQVVHVLRMNSPATSRVGNGGCPGPTRHTERKRPARKFQSIFPASRTSGWRRLMISSRGGPTRLSCKFDYLLRSNHRDRSIAS